MLRTLLFALTVSVTVCLPSGPSPRSARWGGTDTKGRDGTRGHSHSQPGAEKGKLVPRHVAPKHTSNDGSVLVEMDMKMKKDYYDYLHGKSQISPRKGLRDEKYRWTDNTIPYHIDSTFNEYERNAIRSGMDEWEKYTCLKMTPRNGEADYIHIKSLSGCWSWVGMEGGPQELSLDVWGCIYHHTIVHELGHAVGFHHEQTRPDRDEFVEVLLENIQPGMEYNFDKYDWKLISDFGVKYDYWSVMHYSSYAFSAYGGMTIKTLNEDFQDIIGSVPGLSFKDIQAANVMYKCDSHCTNECPEKTIRSKDCKCWCNNLSPTVPVVEWDGVSECLGGDDFTDACIDYIDQCPTWASDGECDKNPSFMLVNCRKSCSICGENPVCKNYNDNCDYWAMIGECQSNPGWMNMHCRKSCKICGDDGGGDPDACEDRWELCAESVANNECEVYPSMLVECPVSCQVCGDNAICRNWNILCPTWQEMGECEANPDWMNRNCPRACGACEGGEIPDCKNYQDDADCDYWAGTGECVLNPGFMLYSCAKSCRVCGDDADCLNYDPNCHYWKENGLCETDKPGMNFNCPLACDICTGDGLDTETCENNDFNCERWEEMGECDVNPAFMLYYCPRSCRMCGDDQVCKNFHVSCDQWASEGECAANPGYMELHCRPACGICNPSGSTTTPSGSTTTPSGSTTTPSGSTTTSSGSTTTPSGSTTTASTTISATTPSTTTTSTMPSECADVLPDQCKDDVDYDEVCAEWAAAGECERVPSEMYRFCQKSCQMCGPDVKCKDYNSQCESWGETGQCHANPGYMYIFCRQSCECC